MRIILFALAAGRAAAADEGPKQTRYALRAAAQGGLVLAIEARDGCVVCGASGEAFGPSWAAGDDGDPEKVSKIAPHCVLGTAGMVGDARMGRAAARRFATGRWLDRGARPSVASVAEDLADASGYKTKADEPPARPVGAAFLVAGCDDGGAVYEVDARASPRRWRAKAIGGNAAEADRRLEAELRALAERRGLDFPALAEPAPWDLKDALAVAAGVVDACAGDRSAVDLAVVRAGTREPRPVVDAARGDPEPPFDASVHDDGWDSPGGPAVEVLGAEAFAEALADLKAQRADPPPDPAASASVQVAEVDLGAGGGTTFSFLDAS